MRILTLILSILSFLVSSMSAMALNERFFKKTDEKVWNMNLPEFNALVDIPDSVSNGSSAVIIADYLSLKVDREVRPSEQKRTGKTNRMTRDRLHRVMVKLLDQSAVDNFADFEFGDRESNITRGHLPMLGYEPAFGARIHKPDGSIVPVDVKDAFTLGEGKSGDDNRKFKIAIPNLSVGDVLDYYYYSEEWLEEYNLPPIEISVTSKYPIMHLMINGEFNPDLTIEYRSYNDAPLLLRDINEKGNNTFNLHVVDIPAVEKGMFTSLRRQIPFIGMVFLNNTSLIFRPNSSRVGGFYGNLPAGTYYRDIANVLKVTTYDNPIPGRVVKLVKEYMANHPDMTDDDLVAVAWIAFQYVINNDDRHKISPRLGAVMFCDVLKKLKIQYPEALGIGVLNSRNDVPVNAILSWNDPDYVAVYGETVFNPKFVLNHQPGESAGIYQGEMVAAFPADGSNLDVTALPVVFKVPNLHHSGNSSTIVTESSLNDDGGLDMIINVTLAGAQKDNVMGITLPVEWTECAEDFLEISEKKRVKKAGFDHEGRRVKLKDQFVEWIENAVGVRPSEIKDYHIRSRGNMPDSPKIEYTVECSADNLVSPLGNGYKIDTGRLFGRNPSLKGKDRERLFDAILGCEMQDTYTLTLHIPDGYAVSPESLAALDTRVVNLVGMFYSHATVNDAGDLVIQSRVQLKTNVVPLSHWEDFLAILDAAVLFGDTSVVLTRK